MGKKYSKQAWLSREGPEGDCVVDNNSANPALNNTLVEEPKEKTSFTADFTYKGYPVNLLQDGLYVSEKDYCKKHKYCEYPFEVVELPDEPDGKKFEVLLEREGHVEAATQTSRPITALSECGQSLKSSTTDRQEWSYTLYDFEGQGRVTREDLKNLVRSIYEVLGKNVSQPKGTSKDPVKKLCVRLSVSKEKGREVTEITKQESAVSANGFQEQARKTKGKKCVPAERGGSMTVNPPSLDHLNHVKGQGQGNMCEVSVADNCGAGGMHRRRTSCKRCEQRHSEKDLTRNESRKPLHQVDSHRLYRFPRRMQTGPGECLPPMPDTNEMMRVKEWISQWCSAHENEENEKMEERHRHKQKSHHRHRVCQADNCGVSCGLRRCPQYLDLATDHLTFPYHTGSQSFVFGSASPRPQRHHRSSENHHCKHHCSRDGNICRYEAQPVIHRHEHHHHHNHHHYHHYVS